MKKKTVLFLVSFYLVFSFGCEQLFARKEKDTYKEDVEKAISKYEWGSYEKAANRLYELFQQRPTTEAAFYLAKSLYHMGLSHATVEFLYEATLKGGELLDSVVQAVHYIVNERPYDWDLIMRDLIGDHIFGVLSDENADFLYYYKGYMAYEDNVSKWKKNAFKKIRPETTYAYKAEYIDIIDMVRRWKISNALAKMQNLVKAEIQDKGFRNKLFQTYGRLLFQKKRFYEAFDTFRVVDFPILESEELFLEKAWTLYYLQDYQGALGNLLSLDAPIYSGYNKPERFVLQGLIFQKLCHFELALEAIKLFRETYKDTLKDIKQRKNLDENKYMYEAFRRHPDVRREVEFLDLLRWERKKLEEYSGSLDDSGLYKQLVKIYDYKLDEIFEKIDREKDEVYEKISEVLLYAEEQIAFLEYEINMDSLKRRKLFKTSEEMELMEEKIGNDAILTENVFRWPFEGEFWTDELGEYRVLVTNECEGLTE